VNSITSRNPRSGLGAYDLIGHALGHLDMDKLSELPMLRRTPQSRLAGRKGRQSYEFDLAYAEAGSGCSGDCGPGVLPELAPEGLKRPPSPQGPRVSSLDLASAGNARSTASILAVVRAHSPGLRHVYNAFLKQAPGLAGRIRLRFAISPGGDVVEIAALSSTTGDGGFDAAVIAQVRAWRFDPVKAAGNDYVTVPFAFSE
jgi:TonB family protein